jgi:hypothetical protein
MAAKIARMTSPLSAREAWLRQVADLRRDSGGCDASHQLNSDDPQEMTVRYLIVVISFNNNINGDQSLRMRPIDEEHVIHNSLTSTGKPERPIENSSQDILSRGSFAERIADSLIDENSRRATGVVVAVIASRTADIHSLRAELRTAYKRAGRHLGIKLPQTSPSDALDDVD